MKQSQAAERLPPEERSSISNPVFISDRHEGVQGFLSAWLDEQLIDGACAPCPKLRQAWAEKGRGS